MTVHGRGLRVGGVRRFLTGGNYTPVEYGQSFGRLGWYPAGNGVSRHPNYVGASLAAFRKGRVHVLRVPLVADGRAVLDRAGRVRGYDGRFRADVRALLGLARRNDQKVEFTLVDFLLAGRGETVDGVALRGRPQVFTDPGTRAALFRRFVRPFLRDFGSHPAMLALDAVNEPEWLVSKGEGGGWEDVDPKTRAVRPIPRAALEAFLRASAAAVREVAPRLAVTVGTSAKNLPLTAAVGDWAAVHHYPYMGPLARYASGLPSDRPWLLEEYPTSDEDYAKSAAAGGPGSLGAYLTTARSLGAAGALLWSLNPGGDPATMSANQLDLRLRRLRAWCERKRGTLCDRR